VNQTILVVDDSSTVRKFVSVSLSMQGFRVVTAEDGMDALEKLPKEPIDLIITDLNMPNMDGMELIRTLRSNSTYHELPIIILTSLKEGSLRDESQALGIHSYLNKPFSLEKVQYEVSKYLAWSE